MRSMNAVLLDWRPKRTAHVRVATACKIGVWYCSTHPNLYFIIVETAKRSMLHYACCIILIYNSVQTGLDRPCAPKGKAKS